MVPVSEELTINIDNPSADCQSTFPIPLPDCSCTALASIADETLVLDCNTPTVLLDGSASSLGSDYTISWYDESGVLVSDEVIFETSSPGEYTLEVTDIALDCKNTSMIVVIDQTNPPPAVILHGDTILTCNIVDIQVSVEPQDHLTYLWDIPSQSTMSGGTSEIATQDGMVQLIVTDTLTGCTAVDVVTILIDTLRPELAFNEFGKLDCDTDLVEVTAEIDVSGDYTAIWTSPDGHSFNQLGDTDIQVVEAGSYHLLVTNSDNGCEEELVIEVEIDTMLPDIVPKDLELNCAVDSVLVVIDETYTAQWISQDGSVIHEGDLWIDTPGDYTIITENTDNGCEQTETLTVTEQSNAYQLSVLPSTENVVEVGEDLDVTIVAGSAEIVAVIWEPMIPCDNCLEYTFENLQSHQSYTVTTTDINGCQEQVTLEIRAVKVETIFVPNVILLGLKNDGIFYPQSHIEDIRIDQLSIYDRWGNLVFQNKAFNPNDPKDGWDGMYNGQKAESGVYVYHLLYTDATEETQQLAGDVTVLW